MVMTRSMWLWVGGAVVAALVAWALGMPTYTLLLLALVLACPAAMYFGMSNMHRGSRRDGTDNRMDARDRERTPRDREDQRMQDR